MKLKAKDLKLGDVIQAYEGAFGTAVVTKVTDSDVHLFRPYAITSDFETTGGLIPYTGTESYSVSVNWSYEYEVYQRKEVR